jgi:hypothetical protein
MTALTATTAPREWSAARDHGPAPSTMRTATSRDVHETVDEPVDNATFLGGTRATSVDILGTAETAETASPQGLAGPFGRH